MKINILKFLLLIIWAVLLTSCSHRLVGTWNVERYETISPGNESISLYNIGTMTFNSNSSGTKDLNFTVMGLEKKDQIPFTWSWSDGKLVTIDSDGSDFSKTWIIIENKRKTQLWKSTDGSDNVQVMELKK